MPVRNIAPRPEVAEQQAILSDPALAALANATPAQIDAWLAANVTTLAGVRRVLAVLLRVARLYLQERAAR